MRLLLSANKNENTVEIPQLKNIFNYLSRGSSPSSSSSGPGSGPGFGPGSGSDSTMMEKKIGFDLDFKSSSSAAINYNNINSDTNENRNQNTVQMKTEKEIENTDFLQYTEQCGFSSENIVKITELFRKILSEPELAIPLLDSLVDFIHSSLSNKLWKLLNEKYGFSRFLLSMRNTFLMGKGELYQLILDGIVDQTKKIIPDAERADKILKLEILKGASKMLNLDEDCFTNTLSLRLNSANVKINDFTKISGTVALSGTAKYEILKKIAAGKRKANKKIFLCTIMEEDSSAKLSELWSRNVLRKCSDLKLPKFVDNNGNENENADTTDNESTKNKNSDKDDGNNNLVENKYSIGCVWLRDQKYIAKGFSTSIDFINSWSAVRENITVTHSQLLKSKVSVWCDSDTDNNDDNIGDIKPKSNDNGNTISRSSFNMNNHSNNKDDRNLYNVSTDHYEQISAVSFADSIITSTTEAENTQNNTNQPSKNILKNFDSKKDENSSTFEKGAGHLLLGGLSCVVHTDKLGTQVLCGGDLGLKFQGAVIIGVSFHGELKKLKKKLKKNYKNCTKLAFEEKISNIRFPI